MLFETEQRLRLADSKVLALHGETLKSVIAEEDRTKLIEVLVYWEKYVKGLDLAMKIASTSPEDAITAQDMLYRMHIEPMIANIDSIVVSNQGALSQSEADIKADVNQIIWIVALPLLFAGAVIFCFSGSIQSPSQKARR